MPHDVEIHSSEFEITLDQLVAMNNHREPDEALDQFGGLEKLASILNTDLKHGLSENIEARKKVFGANVFPEPKIPSFFSLLLEALKDEMLIILIIAAIISLILGIFFPPESESGESSSFDRWEGAIEGSAILIAVAIVSLVQAFNNYFQERQFQKLNKLKQDVQVKVQRNGLNTQCSIHDLVVGDVVILGTGNQVPADGFYISGYNCSCNQSDMTGESKPNKKSEQNKQLISGSYVMTGDCTMLVTAVGLNSRWGKALSALDDASDGRETPLQIKLGKLARYIGFVGVGVAAVVFVILFIYWLIDQFEDFEWTNLELLVDNFIIAVTIVVVAVPEGLPLAVTMALAYSLMKMRGDMCLVRYLPACETMGGVTQICSDKTGTLTQNRMNVVQGILADQHFSSPIISGTNPFVHQLLVEGIARNSNSYLEPPKNPGGFPIYVGHPTECALLNWLNKLNEKYDDYRQKGPAVVYRIAFSSDRKRMSTLIPKFDRDHREDGYRLYTKGAPEVLLNRCVGLLDSDGHVVVLTDEKKSEYLDFIEEMASKGLRTLALCYRDFDYFDQPPDDLSPDQQSDFENRVENKLIFIGLTGIEDPVRPEVPDAVRSCITAGITVRMVTGDNLLTAKSIATQCGIWKEGYMAMEGEEFAQLSDEQLDKILPKLVILARCMPTDKIRLVKRLKANKELVAVTGDGTNDAAALRGAHIGLAMGGGTEVARDASDIIILDDNFSSIVKAVMWGRSVFDNIRKFLQFQLTVNVSAMAIAALSALVNLRPLTAVQLLWVNLIMDSLGALALATERPTPALLTRPPKNIAHPKYSLLSPEMWKMIFGQAIYQIFVLYGALLLVGLFRNNPDWNVGLNVQDEALYSLVFNSFIFCQLFNLVVSRKINAKEFNVFEKFFANWLFMGVLVIEVVIQFFLVGYNTNNDASLVSDPSPERIVKFLDWIGYLFSTVPLTWEEWLVSIAIGFVGFIWAFILKLIPTPAEKIYKGEVGDIHGENSPLVDYIESQLEERQNHPLYVKPSAGSTILRTVSNQSLLRKSRSDISKSQPNINSPS